MVDPAVPTTGTKRERVNSYMKTPLVRFLVVGGIGYLVNQVMLFLLYDSPVSFGLPPRGDDWQVAFVHVRDSSLLIASVVAVETAIVSNFLWHHIWTFADRSTTGLAARFLRFNLTSLGSPAISLFCTNTLTPFFGVNYLVANSIGIVLGTTWNWLWASKVIWKRKTRPSAGRA